jgi:decaprenyl-phosphate phosphoribosyltransferase
MSNLAETQPVADVRPSLKGHLQIMRADHWVKNVFVLPGILVALAASEQVDWPTLALRAALGLVAACLVASSNYVINEVLDAKYDRVHPIKKHRPVPSGAVNIPLAYVEWIALAVAGLAIAALVSWPLVITLGALWVMGCIYNIPPVRSKELPYLDVLSEAVNNPLRMLAGWFIVNPPGLAPASLLLSYWMVGCYFMAIKRLAEYRHIADPSRAAAYRKSFAFYTERRLTVSIMFYGCAAMLFFGAFLMRYRLELLLSAPLVALVMAIYLDLAFKDDSAAQAPEKLHREPGLMAAVVACAIALTVLFFVELPWLHKLLTPTMPVPVQTGV